MKHRWVEVEDVEIYAADNDAGVVVEKVQLRAKIFQRGYANDGSMGHAREQRCLDGHEVVMVVLVEV